MIQRYIVEQSRRPRYKISFLNQKHDVSLSDVRSPFAVSRQCEKIDTFETHLREKLLKSIVTIKFGTCVTGCLKNPMMHPNLVFRQIFFKVGRSTDDLPTRSFDSSLLVYLFCFRACFVALEVLDFSAKTFPRSWTSDIPRQLDTHCDGHFLHHPG